MKKLQDNVVKVFNRLAKRERRLIVFLAAAVAFSVYYNVIYKPQSGALANVGMELQNVNNQEALLRSQIADVDKEKEALRDARRSLHSMKERLTDLESRLPAPGSTPEILGELVRQTSGYYVDFISIKPKTDRKRSEYDELVIEMMFDSTYSDFNNYLNRLESLYPFLKATNIVIEETEGFNKDSRFRGNDRAKVTLTVATLLSRAGMPEKAIKEEKRVLPISLSRNPFASILKPAKEEEEKEFVLSGVIATGARPTAVINNEVYRLGDEIDGKVVKQISRNMVVLSDSARSIVLTTGENKDK